MFENAALGMLVFAPGLAIGSFLNVIASRVPLDLSIGTSRSECMSCGHEIRWYDNIPLASFIVLRGRCRDCGARIPSRYPIVELGTALLVTLAFVVFGASWYAVLAAGFLVVLVAISVIDLEHHIIPNKIVLPAAAVTLVAHTLIDPSPEWAIAAVAAFAALLLVALIKPGAMGMGDVKLCLLLGAMLGRDVAVALLFGFILAMLPSLYLYARHGKSAGKMAIPLGPFLALGSTIALFFGGEILDAWLGLSG